MSARIRARWAELCADLEHGDEPEPWHGTLTGYVYRACRCTECRTAWAAYMRGRRRERRQAR